MIPKIRCVLLCEDLRREPNGKEILIGVYSGGIIFSRKPPGRLRQLLFRVEVDIDKPRRFDMQLVAPSGAILFAREQDIAVERPGRGMIIIQHLDLVLYEARPYKLIAGFDGNIETIDTVDVSFGQSNQNVNDTTA